MRMAILQKALSLPLVCIPNSFKIKVNDIQKCAYISYASACNYAKTIGGIIIDGNNGKQIYP